jgi:hypothetical protein
MKINTPSLAPGAARDAATPASAAGPAAQKAAHASALGAKPQAQASGLAEEFAPATTKAKGKLPAITTTHEWIRLNLGNNRGLSCSYGGEKATGAVPPQVFQLWSDAHGFKPAALARLGLPVHGHTPEKEGGATHGMIVQAFADQIDTIWPEWNQAPKIPPVGEKVVYDFGKRRGGEDTGEVVKVRGTMLTIRFARTGLLSMAADMLHEKG